MIGLFVTRSIYLKNAVTNSQFLKERINQQIRAKEVRVIGPDGENIGVFPIEEALKQAEMQGLDLIEIGPNATPPIVKIMEFGKYQYELAKKQKKMKAGSKTTETKAIQVKPGTGDHDLALKAKKASEWLTEGHRIKVELFLPGRSKYINEDFLKARLQKILTLISEPHKVAEELKRGPKGFLVTIERDSSKKKVEKEVVDTETSTAL